MGSKKEDLIKQNKEEYDYDKMSFEERFFNELEKAAVEEINRQIVRKIGGVTVVDRVETRKRFPDNSSE